MMHTLSSLTILSRRWFMES